MILDARNEVSNPGGNVGSHNPLGLAIHHTVTRMGMEATEVQERAHIRAIDTYHVSIGYGGFGYHDAVFPSGRVYHCGDGRRAHVGKRNHELVGIAVVGDFSFSLPGEKQMEGVLEVISMYPGNWPVKGHNNWALPGEGTACAGQLNEVDFRGLTLGDPTLEYVAGRDGLYRLGEYLVLYNAGVPIWRYGGKLPGQTAKNFGGKWVWLRANGEDAYWSNEEGD